MICHLLSRGGCFGSQGFWAFMQRLRKLARGAPWQFETRDLQPLIDFETEFELIAFELRREGH